MADDSPDRKQDARLEPTESEASIDLDLSDEDDEERREKHREGNLTVDDIQDDDLREKVKRHREEAGLDGDDGDHDVDTDHDHVEQEEEEEQHNEEVDIDTDTDTGGDGDPGQKVRVNEGESPLEALEDESEEDDGNAGLMDGVSDGDLEDEMDMSLNVRDDIDPEHFDYDDQDFSVFGGYGQQVTIEFNETLFLLEQPTDREQEALINNMGDLEEGMAMTDMMSSLIDATVEKPADIDEITSGWTPFERMGLGMQCMEFLGLEALGNI